MKEPNSSAVLQQADDSPTDDLRGEVTIKVLFDPPGHIRLPIDDDELVDRTVTAKWLSGRDLRFLTFDMGQAMRAGAAGLHAIKLKHPAETEREAD